MSAIDGYLRELDAALRCGRRERRRILAECEDHLRLRAQGVGEDAAVRAFGAPRELAARFAQERAADGARGATGLTAAAMAGFVLLFGLSTQVGPVQAVSPFAADPANAVASVAVQIAIVAGTLSLLRALRHRRSDALAPDTLRYVLRGDALALGCIGVSLAADVAALAGHPGVAVRSAWGALLVSAVAGMVALTLMAMGATAAAVRRARWSGPYAIAPAGDDAYDDLAAFLPSVRRLACWPRGRPWAFALTVGALCGAVLAAASLREHGFPGSLDALGRSLAAAGLILGIELTAVLAGFAVFGRYLGIRR